MFGQVDIKGVTETGCETFRLSIEGKSLGLGQVDTVGGDGGVSAGNITHLECCPCPAVILKESMIISRVRRHGVRVGGGEHDSVLAHYIVLVGKRLDQAARPSFKARPSILGGQFQNPWPWDHGDPGKQHGFGLLNCSKLSVIRM